MHQDSKARTSAEHYPSWWNKDHETVWERIKGAFRRDWEQTKADATTSRGHELNQSLTDTVKQAAGSEPIPADNVPNPPKAKSVAHDWEREASALRYGYSARAQFADQYDWNASVEYKLRSGWDKLETGRTWDEVRASVRCGWQRARDGL